MFRIQEAVIEGGDLEGVLEDVGKDETDWEWRGKDGRTVLELASTLGRSEMVKLLIAAGASPNHCSAAGYAGLHLACVWGHLHCTRELVRAGADLRLATGLGETPVQLALRYEKIACAQFLSCTEARQLLHQAVQAVRETLADTELIAGKWNKEDKSKVNSLCTEKTDWLVQNQDCSEEEATQQSNYFHLCMQPYLAKLEPRN